MMISQADIIRSLVNKNCTDESIMSMVLSPGCTPPKLLEKFTEVERFDLALDFSMKMGLDVTPLWRIWGIRCLQNRNFQSARDKFKHCFTRFRSPQGKTNSASGKLLSDILQILNRVEENKLPLSEEIELIKRGESRLILRGNIQTDQKITSRPTIFNECIYYLQHYGGFEELVKFFIQNDLWDQSAESLIDKRNLANAEKFFVNEVIHYCLCTGKLEKLISAILKIDPHIVYSAKYFKATYSLCAFQKRYNLLYYVQTTIKDYLAAAYTQINNFYLRKPVSSYKELLKRLPHLTNANQNFQTHLNTSDNYCDNETFTFDSTGASPKYSIIKRMPTLKIERKIKIVDLQIKLTRNFAINEVVGCINNIEVVGFENQKNERTSENNKIPVTLFDHGQRRKTFLTALVLTFFDENCASYFSTNGLKLANDLIKEFELDKLKVFKTAMRIIIEDESSDNLTNARLLISRLREDFLACAEANASTHRRQQRKSTRNSTSVSIRPHAHQEPSMSPVSIFSSSSSRKSSSSLTNSIKSDQSQNSALRNEEAKSPQTFRKSNKIFSMPPGYSPTRELSASSVHEAVRMICDEVIGDAVRNCKEPDYKMELTELLSDEAKIELYIELGKLSNAQNLAFTMNRKDYVLAIVNAATKSHQRHVLTVCQHWLAKHDER